MYERIEKYTVIPRPEKSAYEVIGIMEDDIHDIKTRLTININTMTIAEAEACGNGIPFSICPDGMNNITKMIGTVISPGINLKIRTKLMGPDGCTHVGELIMGSIRAFLQGVSRDEPEWVDKDYLLEQWNEWLGKYKDQCIAFAQPGISRDIITKMLEAKKEVQ